MKKSYVFYFWCKQLIEGKRNDIVNCVKYLVCILKSKKEKLLVIIVASPFLGLKLNNCVCGFMPLQLSSKNEWRHRRGHVRITWHYLFFFTYDMLYIYIYIYIYIREREREKGIERERKKNRARERESMPCVHINKLCHVVRMWPRRWRHSFFCYLCTKIKNRNTKKLFPFSFCIIKTNITNWCCFHRSFLFW